MMNRTDRLLFAGFFSLVFTASVIMSGIAVSFGDAFLALVMILVAAVCAFIIADALRHHGKHEESFR
jgi:hypothetical protein